MSSLSFPELIMIRKDGENKTYYKFEPTQDITAWQAAKLLELYAYSIATQKQCDWWSFVEQNGLEQHFTITELKEE